MNEEMLIEILKVVQKKYQHISEIERITRDMGDALSRNDRESAQMLLAMRQDEMNQADQCDRHIGYLSSALSPDDAVRVNSWVKGICEDMPEEAAARRIAERGKSIRFLLKKAIDVDRHISSRLAGKDSFYK